MATDVPDVVRTWTVFFELPYDIGADLVHTWTYERCPPWKGWDASSMAAFVGLPEPLEEGLRPQCRIAFRRTATRKPNAKAAVELAFSDALLPAGTRVRRAARQLRLRLQLICGAKQDRTVAGVTHWSAHGESSARGGQLDQNQLDQDVLALNDFLTAYGLISHDPLLGPIPVTDLPAVAPIIGVVGVAGRSAVVREFIPTNLWQRGLLTIARDPDDLLLADRMFEVAQHGEDPTFRVVALLHGPVLG